jgi:16S rRNA (cytosine967-C5)-methyltransferase
VIDPAREAAYQLLAAVRTDDAYANIAWPSIMDRFHLAGRDAAFATDLAYGTLRWQGFYDAVASRCSTRPWNEVDPALADVIRLGIHQLLAMRVPDHAAVDSSCELARAIGFDDRGRVGFVNGVLRAVGRKTPEEWLNELEASPATDASLALTTSHPEWMVAAIRRALDVHEGGAVTDRQLREALLADNTPSRPCLAFRQGEAADEPGVSPGRWLPSAGVVDSGMPGQIAAVRDGRAIVQDEGSQLVVQALLAVPVTPPESSWLDMCAGPGGKAALLADAAVADGVSLLAVEVHQHRADLVRRIIGIESVEVLTADATTRPWGSRFFDRILVDAPSTGLGALRRRPEARWRRQPTDVPTLGVLQRQLLDIGLSSLRSGGVLGYVTCSPHVAETIDVVDEVLLHRDDVEVLDAREYMPGVPDLGPGPHAQLWPHLHGTDAMHIALIRRN